MTEKKPFSFKILRDKPGVRQGERERLGGELFDRLYSSTASVKPWVLHNDDINVSLENFTIKEDSLNGFDIVVSIELKEYRKYGLIRLLPPEKSEEIVVVEETPREETKEPAKTYTVKPGDNLSAIAAKELGDSSKWKTIYELNKDVIEQTAKKYGYLSSSNGWWIFPGCELRLN